MCGRIQIRIRIKLKCTVRIRIKVMRIPPATLGNGKVSHRTVLTVVISSLELLIWTTLRMQDLYFFSALKEYFKIKKAHASLLMNLFVVDLPPSPLIYHKQSLYGT